MHLSSHVNDGLEITMTAWRAVDDGQPIPVMAQHTTELQRPRGMLGIVKEGEENSEVAVMSLFKLVAYSSFECCMPLCSPRLRKEII